MGAIDTSKGSSVDAAFLAPFVSGVVEVLTMQIDIKVEKQKPFVKTSDFQPDIGIIGMITLDCPQFKGVVAVCFPQDVFLKLYEAILGESHSELNAEVQDGAAEILNMVYGQAKTVLKQKGYELGKAIPSVVLGGTAPVEAIEGRSVIVVPFKIDFGTFHLEFIMQD
ncbi:MAG: chemotaxis protein CheX [Bdellovibrionales bacterium]